MPFLSVIELSLFLLNGALSAANKGGAAAAVTAISGAIAELKKVQGTPVTKAQVEKLRIEPTW